MDVVKYICHSAAIYVTAVSFSFEWQACKMIGTLTSMRKGKWAYTWTQKRALESRHQ